MQPHQSTGGPPMGSSHQLQELQKMQRLQQQMQAQLQQAAGQRPSQQQGLPQMPSPMGFANQQWMDQSQPSAASGTQQMAQRNSFTGMNPAFAMMQHPTQGNAQAALYWNALQASNKGAAGSVGDGAGSSMAAVGGMQALQGSKLGATNNQQVVGGPAKVGGAGAIPPTQQSGQRMSQLHQKMGSRTSFNAGQSGPQPQLPNASSSSAQLLLHQQNMIADLKRQLHEQQQNVGTLNTTVGASSGGGSILPHPGGMDRRSTSAPGNILPGQQQQPPLMTHRSSSASGMIQQMSPGIIPDQGRGPAGSSLLQRQHSSPSISSVPGMQNSMGVSQMRRTSSTTGENALLGNVFGASQGVAGAANNPAMFAGMQQQAHFKQMGNMNGSVDPTRAGTMDDHFMAHGMTHMGQDNLASAQKSQHLMGQAQSRSTGQGGSQGQQLMQSETSDGNVEARPEVDSAGKKKGRRKSSAKGKSKKTADNSSEKSDNSEQGQQSFLDGTFAGGWQSNVDLPDRRRIIYSIVKVIEQMRPDANSMSQKLPIMAKRLEEHLYRSAQTKEEYLDPSTLKSRLQMIAHGLEVHRSTSSSPVKKSGGGGSDSTPAEKFPSGQETVGGTGVSDSDLALHQQFQQLEQLQQLQQLQQQQLSSGGAMHSQLDPAAAQLQENVRSSGKSSVQPQTVPTTVDNSPGILKTESAKYQDPASSQKKKVIRQQQQRLLLLRHASKCTAGPSCKTKFCAQMVALWKHMKKCRDKNCKTAHCLSSRCVLNHYRICKGENKTSTCEVCAPVMRQIKLQSSQSGEDPMEALARDHLPSSDLQQADRSGSASLTQVHEGADSALGPQKRQQLEELQAAQQKLHQQQLLLKQLQQQQAQLLEQQKQLQHQQQHVLPQTQQGQQLQQQEALLQQLQQQFQQQQLLLQQDLLRKSQTLQGRQNQAALQPMHVAQTSAVDGKADGSKGRRRASQGRRGSKKQMERQSSSSSVKEGKGSRRRTGKGKRLSAMETLISPPALEEDDGKGGHSISMAASIDSTGSSKKRSLDASDEKDAPSKVLKLESTVSDHKPVSRSTWSEPDETDSSPAREKVLQQGNEEHITALIPSMTTEAIEQHLESLHDSLHLTSRTISQKCLPIIQKLLEHQFGWVFRDPVDPVVLGLPDYFDVVKNPMHLDLVRKKVENSLYKDMESFERDTKLVFENAILYNGEDSEVGKMAQSMLDRCEKDYGALLKAIKIEQQTLKRKGDACSLCGSQRRIFEPTVMYCNGDCGMQKIRRNATYYTDRTKLNHWCAPCFSSLKEDDPILLDDGNEIRKKDLQKFKNDALPEEAWVQCDCCHGWVHQICALFNGRKNKTAATYTCPKCHIKKIADGEADKPEQLMKCAKDLPHCKMSIAIENGLKSALVVAYEERARETGVSVDEVEKAEGLTVRVVSNMEKKHIVRDQMYERYAKNGCPSEYPVRSKCIALFQTIHGVDVLLFGMYVYEYGHACPAPNRRRVYISYLDSVHYFEPKCYRTVAYHAIIIEYLRYVKERGFHTAHIWSCPPSPGDDYIFYNHPSQQLIPRDDMLRGWYHDVLDKAKAQGIVLQTRTLYDEYFKNSGMDAAAGPAVDPTCLPYFEGDYIPGEVENIIKDLNNQEESKRKDDTGDAGKTVGKKLGTRSNPGELVKLGQDKVMLRLGQAMSNMRQNFMVVHLRSRKFAAAVERGEDVSNFAEDEEEEHLRSKKMRIGGKDSSMLYPVPVPSKETDKEDQSKHGNDRTNVGDSMVLEKMEEAEPEGGIVVSKDRNDMEGKDDVEDSVAPTLPDSTALPGEKMGKPESKEKPEEVALEGRDVEAEKIECEPVLDRNVEASIDTNDGRSEGAVSHLPETGTKSNLEKDKHDLSNGKDGEAGSQSNGKQSGSTDIATGLEGNHPPEQVVPSEAGKSISAASIAFDHFPDAQIDDVGETMSVGTVSVSVSPPSDDENVGDPTQIFGAEESAPSGADFDGNNKQEDAAVKEPGLTNGSTTVASEEKGRRGSVNLDNSGMVEIDTHTLHADAHNAAAPAEMEGTGTLPVEQGDAEKQPFPENRGLNENKWALSRHFASMRSSRPIGSTADEDEPQENEMFESRQQFLNYCQTNHFQFDELRRGKHTTMMILFQLHNPSAPKFLQQCGSCYRQITHGMRYHCNDCSNFDLCQECYEPVITGMWAQRDSRFAHDKNHSFTAIDMEAPADTQKSREERSRSIKAHLELLAHAGSCEGPPGCSLKNCEKMKSLFEHVKSCEVTFKNGCKVCARLLSLMTMHARMCTVRGECPIPFCDRIRERNWRLRQQQQQMDDRRRQAQNELYRAGGSSNSYHS